MCRTLRAYHMLCRQEPYRELGANDLDSLYKVLAAKCLVKRLEALGFVVQARERDGVAILGSPALFQT